MGKRSGSSNSVVRPSRDKLPHGGQHADTDESKGQPTLLDTLLEKLRLQRSAVVACYVLGSRGWGTAHKGSDYDLVVVTSDSRGKTKGAAKEQIHGSGVDACVVSENEFRVRVQRHEFMLVPCRSACTVGLVATPSNELVQTACLWLPATCVLLQRKDFAATFVLDPAALFESTLLESARDWRRVRQCFKKGQAAKAKKIVGHTLRMVLLARQIATHGKIVDYSASNPTTLALMRDYSSGWEACRDAYLPSAEKDAMALGKACHIDMRAHKAVAQLATEWEAGGYRCGDLRQLGDTAAVHFGGGGAGAGSV